MTVDHSLGPVWSPVDDVVEAAMLRGVLVAAVHDDDGIPAHAQVLVDAHDGVWVVYRSRDTGALHRLGWVACRLHPDGAPVEGTLGWLGAADVPGDGLVEHLLETDVLATDLRGHEPPVLTAHPMRQADPSGWYVRCPECRMVAPPSSVEYRLGPDGEPLLGHPVQLTCGVCGHRLDDARGWTVPHDGGGHRCPRRTMTTEAPARAARIHCTRCGVHSLGDYLTDGLPRDRLRQVEQQHWAVGRCLRSRWSAVGRACNLPDAALADSEDLPDGFAVERREHCADGF